MTPLHKSNLARTALAVLLGNSGLKFKMQQWRDEDECGTACCLAGHGPEALGVPVPNNWDRFNLENFGTDYCANADWRAGFLFGSQWDNDREQCATRVLLLMEGLTQDQWGHRHQFPVPADLKDRLKAFVL